MTDAPKDQRLYVVHILEALRKIKRYTRDGKARFLEDELIQDAVYRNFLVIGEATKRLSEEVRALDESIPWRAMAGMRDVLVHRYEGIDAEVVWSAIESEFPHLEFSVLRTCPLSSTSFRS